MPIIGTPDDPAPGPPDPSVVSVVGTPVAPGPPIDETLSIVRPEITRVEGRAVLAKRPAVATVQGMTPAIEMVLRDRAGKVLNVSSVDDAGGRIELRLIEPFMIGRVLPVKVVGAFEDPPRGVVRAALPSVVTEAPGAMIGEWGLYDALNRLVVSYDFYLLVERGQFGAVASQRGLPAVDEIRAWMRDSDPNDNYLLKTLEFDLSEVVEAMVECVRAWNTSHPLIPKKYNTCTFPAPSAMRDGIMGRLYQFAAKHYRRAQLSYSAAGTSIDDKNKSQEYEAIGAQMWKTYTDWVRTDKARINRDAWNGTFGSPYGPGARA